MGKPKVPSDFSWNSHHFFDRFKFWYIRMPLVQLEGGLTEYLHSIHLQLFGLLYGWSTRYQIIHVQAFMYFHDTGIAGLKAPELLLDDSIQQERWRGQSKHHFCKTIGYYGVSGLYVQDPVEP